ncbi:hypothetical protein FDI95_gp155 [Citrobacter phage CF1 ERZ-2017]|uniref:Uncharacterized protein n=1 Tax=Citrobacter phage CF1 ERZ-2017 TaxID=2267236 RepID=A0A2H4YG75_9CAUD|nr:hypothetical protein FDI95_gp155 [Citrobacter phage CF1 ERZ-2017]AUE23178.1 hypothetical protein Cf1_00315 [Citrobacter phage CF1 ERZ-2017]
MLPHQQRVLDEQKELGYKIDGLEALINNSPVFKTLSEEDQFLLRQQLTIMNEYDRILNARILRF